MHADAQYLNALSGENMRSAGVQGQLTNTNVSAANTVDGIRALFTTEDTLLHADVLASNSRYLEGFNYGVYDGSYTDGTIAGLTTVTELVDLTLASENSNLNQME